MPSMEEMAAAFGEETSTRTEERDFRHATAWYDTRDGRKLFRVGAAEALRGGRWRIPVCTDRQGKGPISFVYDDSGVWFRAVSWD